MCDQKRRGHGDPPPQGRTEGKMGACNMEEQAWEGSLGNIEQKPGGVGAVENPVVSGSPASSGCRPSPTPLGILPGRGSIEGFSPPGDAPTAGSSRPSTPGLPLPPLGASGSQLASGSVAKRVSSSRGRRRRRSGRHRWIGRAPLPLGARERAGVGGADELGDSSRAAGRPRWVAPHGPETGAQPRRQHVRARQGTV